MRLIWSVRARADLREALAYIRRDSPGNARIVGNRVRTQVDDLRRWPMMGRASDRGDARELVISRTSYIVIYLVTEQGIEVSRLWHGAREGLPPEF